MSSFGISPFRRFIPAKELFGTSFLFGRQFDGFKFFTFGHCVEQAAQGIRKKGSAGGHNGIKSIIAQLGTQNFYRVKVGVGAKPKGWDLADYVLGRFSPQERELVDQAVVQAAEAVEMILSQGIEAAMNHYNGAAKKKKAKTQEEAESPQE